MKAQLSANAELMKASQNANAELMKASQDANVKLLDSSMRQSQEAHAKLLDAAIAQLGDKTRLIAENEALKTHRELRVRGEFGDGATAGAFHVAPTTCAGVCRGAALRRNQSPGTLLALAYHWRRRLQTSVTVSASVSGKNFKL